MKLRIGAIPESKEFDPEAEGWAGIREPGPILLQVLALPVAFFILLLLGGTLYLVWPSGAITNSAVLIVVFILALFPVHELLHAVVFPGGIGSDHTVIGFWPSRFVFYAHYEEEMARNRFLLVFFTPFLVLSLIPIAIIVMFQWPSLELALLSVVNGVAASGDMMGIALVGLQVPQSAVVRNRGWRSYWKVKSTGHRS